jgi:cell division protein FtsW (lipid II flippase)
VTIRIEAASSWPPCKGVAHERASEALTRAQRAHRGPAIDAPTLVLTLALLLLGLTMVTSASITIAGRDGAPFAFLERQLMLVLIGAAAAALTFSIPTEKLERFALPLLLIALALLVWCWCRAWDTSSMAAVAGCTSPA